MQSLYMTVILVAYESAAVVRAYIDTHSMHPAKSILQLLARAYLTYTLYMWFLM
jgi:hypothetical protein